MFFQSDVNFTTNYGNGTNTNLKQSSFQTPLGLSKISEQNTPIGFANLKDIFQSQEYIDAYADDPLSLIWNNEPPKTYKHKKSMSPDDISIKVKKEEQNEDFLPKSFEYEEMYPFDYSNFENSNDYSKSERDMAKMFRIKKEDQEGVYGSDFSSQIEKTVDMRTSMSEKPLLTKKDSWALSRSNYSSMITL